MRAWFERLPIHRKLVTLALLITAAALLLAMFALGAFDVCRYRNAARDDAEALALMNDTQYVEAARRLAERMLLDGGSQPVDRLE